MTTTITMLSAWLILSVSHVSFAGPCDTNRPFTVKDWDNLIASYEQDLAQVYRPSWSVSPIPSMLWRQRIENDIATARQCREIQRQREAQAQPRSVQPTQGTGMQSQALRSDPVLDAFERAKRALLADLLALGAAASPNTSTPANPLQRELMPLDTPGVRIPGTNLRESDYFYDLQMRRTDPRPRENDYFPTSAPATAAVGNALPAVPAPGIDVGRVGTIAGTATAWRGGAQVSLNADTTVRFGDRITTGPDGRVQLRLNDETVFTMGPNSDSVIDDFVYDPTTGAGKFSAQITKGFFRFVTAHTRGAAGAEEGRLHTPVGCLGIRGTDVTVTYVEKDDTATTTVQLVSGAILYFDHAGNVTSIAPGETRVFQTAVPRPLPTTDPIRAALSSGQPVKQGSRTFVPTGRAAGVWVDDLKWQIEAQRSKSMDYSFATKGREVVGLVGSDTTHRSVDEVRDAVLRDWQASQQNVHVVREERRVVNGSMISTFVIDVSIDGQPYSATSYVYTGAQGTVGLTALVKRDAADRAAGDIAELLNGLVVVNPASVAGPTPH